jgi:putative aldouronate transport system permease protein
MAGVTLSDGPATIAPAAATAGGASLPVTDITPSPSPNGQSGGRRELHQLSWRHSLRRYWQLYLLALLPVAYFAIFRYVPMVGNVIAFRKFRPGGSIFGEYWVGTQYFQMLISDNYFWQTFRNTLILGVLSLIFTFPAPIILALLMNEVRHLRFKKFIQTASYLPHFLSIVIVATVIMQMVSPTGPINQFLTLLGRQPVDWIQQASAFRPIYVISQVWQTAGWGTILYLAALTTIDENLYEAASIDGANRWQQTLHVTLPGIMPTIMTVFTLNIGSVLAVGFEKVFLLYNPLTYETADVIETYVYRVGLQSNNFSYATAIGLFLGVIGAFLVLLSNFLSRRLTGTGLW